MATGLTQHRTRRRERKRYGKAGLLDRILGEPRRGLLSRFSEPALDLVDLDDEVIVRADLPGMTGKDVEVEIEQDTLTLRGARHEEREEKKEDYYFSERWEGSFFRTIELPDGVDPDRASARFDAGVLEVHVPKIAAAKRRTGRKVEIGAPRSGQAAH